MALRFMSKSRWLVLVVSCWMKILNSPTYLFSTYSQAMKLSLQLDQTTVTRVSSFINTGTALGVVSGYLYNLLPPWALIIVGASFQSMSLLFIWLTMVHKFPGGAWHLCLYHMIIGASLSFVQTAVLMTNVRNFPMGTAAAVGLLKGYLVLGASVLLQIFYLVSGPEHLINLPRMLSCLVALTLLGMFAVRCFPVTTLGTYERQLSNLLIMSTCLVALSFFLMVESMLEVSLKSLPHSTRVIAAVIILLLLLLLIGPGLRAELFTATNFDVVVVVNQHDSNQPLLHSSADIQRSTSFKEDYSLGRALLSLNFWTLFLALVCGFGSVDVVRNNLAQLANSLGYTQKTASICVSVFCTCSCWGRIGVGLVSDYCLERFHTPKTVFLGLAMMINSLSTALAAVPVRGSLVITTVLSGLVEGALWCLCLTTASDMFGTRSLSMVYNLLLLANMVGSYILTSGVVGYLYDKETAASTASLLCHGGHCFRAGLLVSSGVSLAGSCLCALLTARVTKKAVYE